MSDTDRKTWHDTALGLHQLQRAANEAADAVTTLGTQLTTAESLLKTAGSAPSGGKQVVEEAGKRLAALRPQLGVGQTGGGGGGFGGGPNPNVRARIGQLKGQIMGSTSAPTAMQIRSATEAREDLTQGGAGSQRPHRRRAADLRQARRGWSQARGADGDQDAVTRFAFVRPSKVPAHID